MENRNCVLIQCLKEASEYLRDENFDCLFSSLKCVEELASKLDQIRHLLETKNFNPAKIIECYFLRKKAKLWFMPTSDWDDIVSGEKGFRLGNDVFEKL